MVKFKESKLEGKVVEPLLHIADLHGGYTHKNVLHGISFDVYPGEIVGLIGLNGAGKVRLSSILSA